jgi:tetratricopeptide (TPR) repeat protein
VAENAHPIATQTIARIYVQQGKLEQAEAIYVQLLELSPGDAQLEKELAEVKKKRQESPASPSLQKEGLELSKSAETLQCRWTVTTRGVARARLVLGCDGQLTLRVAGFPADPEVATKDMVLDKLSGSLAFASPPGSSLVTASIGLLDAEGVFASIVHCDMVEL